MRGVFRIRKELIILALLASVLVLGTLSVWAARPPHGGCECANIYAPVVCDGGAWYVNRCAANCAHATNCVNVGGVTP